MRPLRLQEGAIETVVLEAVCDTHAAADLRATLLARTGTVQVQADRVERMTTACVQVLLAAYQAFARQGGGLQVRGASPAMRAAFADLGLAEALDRWSHPHG